MVEERTFARLVAPELGAGLAANDMSVPLLKQPWRSLPVDTAGIEHTRPAVGVALSAAASVAAWHSWVDSFGGASAELSPNNCT